MQHKYFQLISCRCIIPMVWRSAYEASWSFSKESEIFGWCQDSRLFPICFFVFCMAQAKWCTITILDDRKAFTLQNSSLFTVQRAFACVSQDTSWILTIQDQTRSVCVEFTQLESIFHQQIWCTTNLPFLSFLHPVMMRRRQTLFLFENGVERRN